MAISAAKANVTKAERLKLIGRASAAVNKAYGSGSSVRASVDLAFPSVWASLGSLALDRAIAGRIPGGVPLGPKRGKVLHVFGDPSLGKSVLADMAAKNVQDLGGITLISETEGSRDPHFANAIGLDLDGVEVQRPSTVEEMFDQGLDWIADVRRSDAEIPIFWAVDSLEVIEAGRTFGVKMSGKEGGVYEFGGGRAGKIGAGLRKLANVCGKHPTSVLLLNQVRDKVGMAFGDPKRPTGGAAPRFLASVEVKLSSSKLGMVKDGDRVTGRWVHARVVKNKVAAPFREAEFIIDFQKGILKWPGVLEMLERENVVHVRRDAKGRVAEREFAVVASGEVLPLGEFTTWAQREKVLEK